MKLMKLVEAKIVRSACDQQHSYNCNPTCYRATSVASKPYSTKAGSSLDRSWTVAETKSPVTIAIIREDTTRVVLVNCIHPFLEVQDSSNGQTTFWSLPLFQHLDVEDSNSKPTSPIVPHNACTPPPDSESVVKPVVKLIIDLFLDAILLSSTLVSKGGEVYNKCAMTSEYICSYNIMSLYYIVISLGNLYKYKLCIQGLFLIIRELSLALYLYCVNTHY